MMKKLIDSPVKQIRLMLLPCLFLAFFSGTAMARKAVIQSITIEENPLSVQFGITKKVPAKVIQIASKEVLIALKNVVVSRDVKVTGRHLPGIKAINIESLQGDVVAVVVISRTSPGPVTSGFNASGSQFVVSMAPVKTPGAIKTKQAPVPENVVEKTEPAPKTGPEEQTIPDRQKVQPAPDSGQTAETKNTVKIPTPSVYVPPPREKSRFQGDISDLYRRIASSACGTDSQINNAVELITNARYTKAFELLDAYIKQQNPACPEQAYYLRAYAFYSRIDKDDFAMLITAERMFQDALVLYPQSEYVPFAYTAIGMIHMGLNNMSAAQGYFNIVVREYENYPGRPEALFYLAEIFDENGYVDNALDYYKQVFEAPSDNAYILDAGIGYGKALFEKQQYYAALSVFNHVVGADEKKIYDSPDLLQYMGDTGYALSLAKTARENYMRLMNLFEDIPDKDILLSRVGDTYAMENREEKAVQIYEMVREKFPDTQGYITASMGLARYLEADPEKIEMYEMIKNRFPENTYARMAMMRLAEIYQKNGEYNKCIKEIEDLLTAHPRGLRYEAVKLMQKAYEGLFEHQLEKNDYPSVLNRYESEYNRLDKMDSRKIALSVGTAYLRAGLFEEAFNHLWVAYKQYKRSERSPELLFSLGVAMDESDRDDDAVKIFQAFSLQFKNHENRVDALIRAGDIFLEKEQYASADDSFKKAYAAAENQLVKGHILLRHAAVFAAQKDLKKAAELRASAVKAFAAAPGKNYEILAKAYKTLGDTYISLTSYVQAADAFSKALDFSEGDRLKANLGFLLGDAYQKGNILPKARAAFEQVADTYDSVWARLARQRLTTLDLAQTITNS
jgi:tetratricopeptide (TPR) repeat protein